MGAIHVRLADPRQLFQTLDPAPFRERDLDPRAERYIVESAREFPAHEPLELIVELPAAAVASEHGRAMPAAIANYFALLADEERRNLLAILREGRTALAIGLAFLFTCVSLSGLLARPVPSPTWSHILQEGLLISGWVAMWRPIQIFLYEWWPIARRQRLFRRLAGVAVAVRPIPAGVPVPASPAPGA